MREWECINCGYIHEGNEPPEECPECGASRDLFTEYAIPGEVWSDFGGEEEIKEWECINCGYIHVSDKPPKECPECGASGDQFEEFIYSEEWDDA